jgi:hypothetical protein
VCLLSDGPVAYRGPQSGRNEYLLNQCTSCPRRSYRLTISPEERLLKRQRLSTEILWSATPLGRWKRLSLCILARPTLRVPLLLWELRTRFESSSAKTTRLVLIMKPKLQPLRLLGKSRIQTKNRSLRRCRRFISKRTQKVLCPPKTRFELSFKVNVFTQGIPFKARASIAMVSRRRPRRKSPSTVLFTRTNIPNCPLSISNWGGTWT